MTDATTHQAQEWPLKRDLSCPFSPPPELTRLTEEQPLSRARIWDGTEPWIITRHADQRALLADPRVSHDGNREGFPHISPDFKMVSMATPSFAGMDDPEHTRMRRTVTKPFLARRIEAMRPAIQTIVDELVDDMLAGPKPADLVESIALAAPVRIICAMLGVPLEDRDFLQRNNEAMIYRSESGAAVEGALAQAKYLNELIDIKRANPGEDIMSDLVTHIDSGEITQQEACGIGLMLIGAGHETTASMISLGVLALLEHPEQLAEVRDSDDPKIVANAVEELLRYISNAQDTVRRVASEDIEIGGVVIKAGEGMVFPLSASNWDPELYPGADRLDIHRDNANRHLAFGHGTHLCLGATLARVELQIVYRTLLRRVPTLALATSVDQIPFKHDQIAYGVYELPVTW